VWSVVIPVKRLPEAKSRLAPLSGELRAALALAFASDTVAAAAASPLVAAIFAVTGDEAVSQRLSALGVRILPDDARGGLNGAVESGRRRALADDPRRRVAALTSDLPGLRTADLTSALAAASDGRAFVADAPGSGTTLLLSDVRGTLTPRFGPNSRYAHEASGATLLTGAGRSLRRDVDTVEDLEDAIRLGVGAHTTAALARLRWRSAHYSGPMQATVRIFDPATRGGSVLLDDGTEMAYDADAFNAGGLRFARPGQRVALRVDTDGRITALTLATLPLPN
jgi:2-phospho-L-lactate/phosphoenolpyruvate guanylyltransferase